MSCIKEAERRVLEAVLVGALRDANAKAKRVEAPQEMRANNMAHSHFKDTECLLQSCTRLGIYQLVCVLLSHDREHTHDELVCLMVRCISLLARSCVIISIARLG